MLKPKLAPSPRRPVAPSPYLPLSPPLYYFAVRPVKINPNESPALQHRFNY
ncbi:MAG TPA: hypothetical protein VHR27_13155 [Blastocatellia bacterium]|jgi:hypothetical protein|nr:hypothetical protein [Blastocatellia bacterium]